MGSGLIDENGASIAFDAAGSVCKDPLTLLLKKG
jgi:hypothetical protein